INLSNAQDLQDSKNELQQRLREIVDWKNEDDRDNNTIKQLIESMERQKTTIQVWEDENRRDDNRIVELELKCTNYESHIQSLKEKISTLQSYMNDYSNYALNLSIV